MGFFNFWYNFKYFLRRLPKKILVGIIVILLLFIFSTQSHATTINNIPNTDIFQYYKDIYTADWYGLVRAEINYAKSNNNHFEGQFRYFCDRVINNQDRCSFMVSRDYAPIHFEKNIGSNPITNFIPETYYFGYDFDDANTYDYDNSFSYSGVENTTYTQASLWTLVKSSHANNFTWAVTHNANGYSFITRISTKINFIEGLQHYIPLELYDTIYAIATNTYDFDRDADVLRDIDDTINELNTTTSDLNNYIQDDTVDNYTQNDLPQSNITDPTESTFNGIFNRLYTAISNDSYHSVTIPLKFGEWDKSFSLNSNSLDFMRGDRNRDLVAFIELIWSFIIYYYILRDIYNMVNDLSQGKIAEKVDNIKTQLL